MATTRRDFLKALAAAGIGVLATPPLPALPADPIGAVSYSLVPLAKTTCATDVALYAINEDGRFVASREVRVSDTSRVVGGDVASELELAVFKGFRELHGIVEWKRMGSPDLKVRKNMVAWREKADDLVLLRDALARGCRKQAGAAG